MLVSFSTVAAASGAAPAADGGGPAARAESGRGGHVLRVSWASGTGPDGREETEVAVQAEPIAARLDERTLRDILRFADGCVVGSDGIDAAEVDAPAADDGRGSPDLAPSARAAIAPQPLPPPDASGGAVVRFSSPRSLFV